MGAALWPLGPGRRAHMEFAAVGCARIRSMSLDARRSYMVCNLPPSSCSHEGRGGEPERSLVPPFRSSVEGGREGARVRREAPHLRPPERGEGGARSASPSPSRKMGAKRPSYRRWGQGRGRVDPPPRACGDEAHALRPTAVGSATRGGGCDADALLHHSSGIYPSALSALL